MPSYSHLVFSLHTFYIYFFGLTKRVLSYNLETEAYMLSRDANEYKFTFFYSLRYLL